MNTIAILPESGEEHPTTFRAITGSHKATGHTPGEALDVLTSQLGVEKTGVAVVVQRFLPDQFFSAEQRDQLSELMARWRIAREAGDSLPPSEQADLERLVDEEIQGAAERAAQMRRDFRATQESRRSYEEKESKLKSSYEKKRWWASKLYVAGVVAMIFTLFLEVGGCILLLFLRREILNSGLMGIVTSLMVAIAATILVDLLLLRSYAQLDMQLELRRIAEERRQLELFLDSKKHSGDSGDQREPTIAR